MVYFCLVFDNAASAKNYAESYFTERADEVKVRIDSQHYKTTVQYPAGVTSTSDYSYYYNGSILYADSKSQNGGFLSGRCQEDTGKTPTQLALEQRKYQERLQQKGIIQSMSRKGNCLDNSVMENWFGIMKSELLYPNKYTDIEVFKKDLIDYIDYYNNRRIKLKLKGLSPVDYRTKSFKSVS